MTTASDSIPLPQSRDLELAEVLEQLRAAREILRVIADARSDVQPVFQTIVRNAVSLCGSLFANVFRFDGELLHEHFPDSEFAKTIRPHYKMPRDTCNGRRRKHSGALAAGALCHGNALAARACWLGGAALQTSGARPHSAQKGGHRAEQP